MVRLIPALFVCLFAIHANAQVKDGFGKDWSPVKIDKSKKKGIGAVEEAKKKAEEVCKTTFQYAIDWDKFDVSTYKANRFEPYHIGMRCGNVFEALSYLCGKSLEARKNVEKYVKNVSCTLHPKYADIMKWKKDNKVDNNERALLQKDSPEKFNDWFASNCVTGTRLSPTKAVMCELKDKVFTLQYSVWSVNIGSEVQGYLLKYFAE